MANWCTNTVCFSGDEKQIERLIKAFKKSIEKTPEGEGIRFILLPLNYEVQNWFFDLEVDEEQETLRYETRWAPDPVHIMQACKMFSVDFLLSYEESGNGVYGEFQYDHKQDLLEIRELDNSQVNEGRMCCDTSSCSQGKHCKGDNECDDSIEDYDKLESILSSNEWKSCQVILEKGTYSV